MKEAFGQMADDLSAMQKKELYDLNTQFDLTQLDQRDKELLTAGLYTPDARQEVKYLLPKEGWKWRYCV